MQRFIQVVLVAGLIVLVILIKPKFSEDDPAGEYRMLFGSYREYTEALSMQQVLHQNRIEASIVEHRYSDGGRRVVGYRLLSPSITGKLNAEKVAEPLRGGGIRVRVVRSDRYQ